MLLEGLFGVGNAILTHSSISKLQSSVSILRRNQEKLIAGYMDLKMQLVTIARITDQNIKTLFSEVIQENSLHEWQKHGASNL